MSASSPKQHSFDPFTSRPVFGYYDEPARPIPIVGDTDVLVVGGSQSGCAAAICAARHGARVTLVERFGFLGGQSIFSSVVQWEKRAFINNLGAVATRGIAQEMLNRIVAKGDSDGLWQTPPGCPEMRDGEEWLNPEAIIVTLTEMCQEAGVELLFHTMAADVIVEREAGATPRLAGVIFENKSGRFAIAARVVVDATADLDLVWKAVGEDGCGLRPPQERQSAGFYVWYSGVDNNAFADYYLGRNDYRGYPDPQRFPDKVRAHLKEEKLVYFWGMQEILALARARGLMAQMDAALAETGQSTLSHLYAKSVGRGGWCHSITGIKNINLLDAWDVTRFEILRAKLASWLLPVLRLTPGWENCYISRTNTHIGLRETRYLKAATMISERTIFSPDNATMPTPPDCVGRSAAHDPGKNRLWVAYPIPYGALLPAALDGVLCCTRAIGVQPPVALNAHRGIVPTIVVGQAAGTAAALAVRTGVQPRAVDLPQLQAALRQDNVVLDVERVTFDWDIPKDKLRAPWDF
jgi:hypothetical protein